LTKEEAEEFHEFNQIGAWMGDGTPAFVEMGIDFLNELNEAQQGREASHDTE